MPISALSNPSLPSLQLARNPRMDASEDGSSWVSTALKATGTVLWLLASVASFAFLGPIPGLVVTCVGGLAMMLAWTGCSCPSNFWNSVASNEAPPMGRRNYVAIASGAPPGVVYIPPPPPGNPPVIVPHVPVGAGHLHLMPPPPGNPPANAPHVPVGAGHFAPPPQPVFTPPPQPHFHPPGAPHVAVGAGHFTPLPPPVAAPKGNAPHVPVGAGHLTPPPTTNVPPSGAPHVGVGTRRGNR